MKDLTETRIFWILLAAVVYPLLFAGLVLLVIMPPINMIGVPIWFMLSAGAVGNISTRLEALSTKASLKAKAEAEAQTEERRYAPGVVPVQRTNAL